MKVQVTVQVPAKSAATKTLDLVVFATDTVSHVKERLSSANPLPSQGQDLVFQGKVLQDDCKLDDCEVQEGALLQLITRGCEPAFLAQLLVILQGKEIAFEELGLLYIHKHGISTGQVLEALGFDGKLQGYLEEQKGFKVKDGRASVACEDITLKVSVKPKEPRAWVEDSDDASDATAILDVEVEQGDKISTVKARAAAIADIPKAFPHLELLLNGKPLDDSQIVKSCGLQDGARLELALCSSESSLASQLLDLLKAKEAQGPLTIEHVGLLYNCKYGVTVEEVIASFSKALRRHRLRDFMVQQAGWFTVEGTRVRPAANHTGSAHVPDCVMSRHKRYLDLHGRVSSIDFRTKIAQAFNGVVAAIMELSFLGIHQVVGGGDVGKGTAIEGDSSAELTLFLENLPKAGHEQWPAGLLESVAKGVRDLVIEDMPAIQVNYIGNHGLKLTCAGFPDVDLRMSPVFATHSEALDVLATQSAVRQPDCSIWLAKQSVKFMKKQPEPVKVTARLLKWWRNQKQWSSLTTRPSDHLLELLAVHVAGQLRPNDSYDQDVAIGLATKIMSSFDEAQITWASPHYGRHKIPDEILSQRPLLADPCNPFVNVAGPQTFDPQEMIAFAKASPELLSRQQT